MENKYQIINPSQKLIVEAINTTPRTPGYIHLDFLADGLKIPYKGEEASEYIKLCKDLNIIPFSSKEIRYGFEVKEKIPDNEEGAKAFFGNGRTNKISMKVNDNYNQGMIKRFGDILLPSLIKNNYNIAEGCLTFSEHKVGSHENEGYDPDLELRLNWGFKGLELMLLEPYVDEEEKKKFENWFQKLQDKFCL